MPDSKDNKYNNTKGYKMRYTKTKGIDAKTRTRDDRQFISSLSGKRKRDIRRMTIKVIKTRISRAIESCNDNYVHSLLRMSHNDWVSLLLTDDRKTINTVRKPLKVYYASQLSERGYS